MPERAHLGGHRRLSVFMNLSNVEPTAHPADRLFRRIAVILQG